MASERPAETEVTKTSFRSAMGRLPTGVTVVTTPAEPHPAGLVANAVTSLSLEPPMVLACLDRGSRTLEAVRESGCFAINVLEAGALEVARGFATKAPLADKWRGVEWEPRPTGPRLGTAIAWIGSEVRDVLDGGDHVIVTGRVTAVEERPGEPLLFHGGDFSALGG